MSAQRSGMAIAAAVALAALLVVPREAAGAAPVKIKNKIKKDEAVAAVETHKTEIIALSDQVWGFAETALLEVRSAEALAVYAEKAGLQGRARPGRDADRLRGQLRRGPADHRHPRRIRRPAGPVAKGPGLEGSPGDRRPGPRLRPQPARHGRVERGPGRQGPDGRREAQRDGPLLRHAGRRSGGRQGLHGPGRDLQRPRRLPDLAPRRGDRGRARRLAGHHRLHRRVHGAGQPTRRPIPGTAAAPWPPWSSSRPASTGCANSSGPPCACTTRSSKAATSPTSCRPTPSSGAGSATRRAPGSSSCSSGPARSPRAPH